MLLRQDNVCTVLNLARGFTSPLLTSVRSSELQRDRCVIGFYLLWLIHCTWAASSVWGRCLWSFDRLYMAWIYHSNPTPDGSLSIKACVSFPSKGYWIVFFFRTFWCDQDRLPHCISGRLRACSSLLCQIRLENGSISSLSKDNKDGKLPRKALFSQGADLLGSHRWYSRFWGSHCSAVKQESSLWG